MKGSEKLIATIKQQDIRQVPKWQFLVKNGFAWVVFLVAVLLGAGAFSVILFAIQQTDFNVVNHLAHSRLELFLGLLPFVWISFLTVFLLVAFHSVQYSKKGYKFTVAKRFGFSAGLSILLGTLFFIGGGAHQLEHAFAVNVELYESIQQKKMKLWSMPEDGYLSGKIEAVNDSYVQLMDFNGNAWQVSYDSAFIAPVVQMEQGETIKMIGRMTSKNKFKAQEIRPWGGRGQRMGGN